MTNNFSPTVPVPITSGMWGTVLIENFHLQEKLAYFNRGQGPVRAVYAKGAGAFGMFTVTQDITEYPCAQEFSRVGMQTPVLVRFSNMLSEMGSADAERDVRGFAIKFYTEDGNWDLLCNNTPVFFIRDPFKFPDLIYSQRRHPQTYCKETSRIWDFWSLNPESLHQITILFSDRGLPRSYRFMHGYGGHTYSLVNALGKRVWCKFHLKTLQGVENLTHSKAIELRATDPDHARRDLFSAIAANDFPGWKVYVQIMTELQAARHPENPFDLTKVWSHSDYPLIEVGVLELYRNPENYLTDVEQAAFSPSAIVPGIGFSPDQMLQARILSYPEAHRHRLGRNYQELLVNCPLCPPRQNFSCKEPLAPVGKNISVSRSLNAPDSNYSQAGSLYRALPEAEKRRLISAIVDSLKPVPETIQARQIAHFFQADAFYGHCIAKGLDIDIRAIRFLLDRTATPSNELREISDVS